jgi:hypothetical protein
VPIEDKKTPMGRAINMTATSTNKAPQPTLSMALNSIRDANSMNNPDINRTLSVFV